MRQLVILCCALVCISVGVSSLKCHLCIGGENSDCAEGKRSAMATQTCGMQFPTVRGGSPPPQNATSASSKIVEYCVKLKLKGNENFSSIVEYGCGYIYDNVDICKYLIENTTEGTIEMCKYCSGDLCN